MKNWDSIQVAVLTPSIWTSSLEFNCFIYNHRADVLACIWDEANGVEDTGYLNFIELARTVEYSSFLNATPVGSAGESGYNNDSLKVAYNMLRGIRKFNEKYNTFFNKYTLSSGVSSNNGNTIFNINTDKYNADFGRYILNLNREDLGVAVSFSEVNFHRCGQTEIQKEYISSGYNIKQVLYSPETAGAFELNRVDNFAKPPNVVNPHGKMELTCHISSLYNTIVGAIDTELPLTNAAFENLILSQCIQFAKTMTQGCIAAGRIEDVVVGYCCYDVDQAYMGKIGEENKTPEIDLVVRHRSSSSVISSCAIEVKKSKEPKSAHAKNFFLPSMAEALGHIDRYIVVYTGKTVKIREVWYVNAYDFLMNIQSWVLKS